MVSASSFVGPFLFFSVGNLLYNLQFFIELCVTSEGFITLFQSYIDFLEHNKYNLYKHIINTLYQ
jgi:hypothetical protein